MDPMTMAEPEPESEPIAPEGASLTIEALDSRLKAVESMLGISVEGLNEELPTSPMAKSAAGMGMGMAGPSGPFNRKTPMPPPAFKGA